MRRMTEDQYREAMSELAKVENDAARNRDFPTAARLPQHLSAVAKVREYLREHGEACGKQIETALTISPGNLHHMATRGHIKRIGRRGNNTFWELPE